MKIDYRYIGKKVGTFFVGNAPRIAGYFISAVACVICDRLGVNTHTPVCSCGQDDSMAIGMQFFPRNATENAITAIAQQGIEVKWDSDKIIAAGKIFDLANNQDDDTRSFAIMALDNIGKTVKWDSGRATITNYIARLGEIKKEE